MSIRRTLLLAFLLISFLATALLAGLAFFASRQLLATAIGQNLQSDARMLMGQVDALMFERLQNLQTWSRLDILQEARIGDVDKRLARFLGELQQGYGGVYRDLFFVAPDRSITASARAEVIGRQFRAPTEWIETAMPKGMVFVEAPQPDTAFSGTELLIRATVPDHFGQNPIGALYGAFSLERIFRLFDGDTPDSGQGRTVILLDRSGRVIAASAGVRAQGMLLSDRFAGWRPDGKATNGFVRSGAPLVDGDVVAGYAASRGSREFVGTGWSLLVFRSVEQAFRPIWVLLGLFFVAFAVTALIAGITSQRVASRVARPLIHLTAWVRGFLRTDQPSRPEVAGALEVRELGQAFGQMMESLERSREQVVHAAKLAVVGEMAAIMAHEVRTPLGILHTSAQMLQREPGLGAEGAELARMILEETGRLGRLISTLLDCARPRPPRMRPVEIHEILARVEDLLGAQARKKGLSIERDLHARPAVAWCDEELLIQVFLNLLMNAIQFSPAGGKLLLGTRNDGSGIQVDVEDQGPGISQEDRGRIFDPFFTTRESGIGLGLTVTQQIIAAHNGSITVDCGASGGARFRIYLPCRQETGE